MPSVSLRFCARRRSATASSSSESSRRSRAKTLSRISSKNRGLCPTLLSDWTLPAEEACADIVPTRSSKMFASRFSSSVSRCSCIALLRSGEKASQKSLPQKLNHGNDRAVSDNDQPGQLCPGSNSPSQNGGIVCPFVIGHYLLEAPASIRKYRHAPIFTSQTKRRAPRYILSKRCQIGRDSYLVGRGSGSAAWVSNQKTFFPPTTRAVS